VNDVRERNYTRSFTVVCSHLTDGPEVVAAAIGIPRLWVPYVNVFSGFADFGSWCRNVDCARVKKGSTVWRVTCTYSSRVERPDINQIENPLLRPAEVSWDTTSTAVPMITDTAGNPIKNAAGDVYDPPPEENVKTLALTITRNQPSYDTVLYLDFEDTVNDATFLNMAAGWWRCVHIKGTKQFEEGIFYWKVTIQLETKRMRAPTAADLVLKGNATMTPWTRWILNRGFRQLKAGKLIACLDPITKQVLSTPALLDKNGLMLVPGQKPVYFGYQQYPYRDFNGLSMF
jgi:hypothetical protein